MKVGFNMIYGSIEDNEYWRLCQIEISKLPSNIQVNYKGSIEHDKVTQIISKYHAFICLQQVKITVILL